MLKFCCYNRDLHLLQDMVNGKLVQNGSKDNSPLGKLLPNPNPSPNRARGTFVRTLLNNFHISNIYYLFS